MRIISRPQKLLFLFGCVVLACIVAWRFFSPQQHEVTRLPKVDESYPSVLTMPPQPVNRLAKPVEGNLDNVDEPPALWVAANVPVPVKLSDRVTEKAVVRFDRSLLVSLENGDEIQFSLPDGRLMAAIVNRVVMNPDGDKTFQAQIKTEFGDYPFIYTMGIRSGSGFIGLPEGRFSIETNGIYSVIYRNPDPPVSTDPGKKDYVIPVAKPW